MPQVAELLERKRKLVERKQNAPPEQLGALEHELREIDEALSRLESKDAPPTAPH